MRQVCRHHRPLTTLLRPRLCVSKMTRHLFRPTPLPQLRNMQRSPPLLALIGSLRPISLGLPLHASSNLKGGREDVVGEKVEGEGVAAVHRRLHGSMIRLWKTSSPCLTSPRHPNGGCSRQRRLFVQAFNRLMPSILRPHYAGASSHCRACRYKCAAPCALHSVQGSSLSRMPAPPTRHCVAGSSFTSPPECCCTAPPVKRVFQPLSWTDAVSFSAEVTGLACSLLLRRLCDLRSRPPHAPTGRTQKLGLREPLRSFISGSCRPPHGLLSPSLSRLAPPTPCASFATPPIDPRNPTCFPTRK